MIALFLLVPLLIACREDRGSLSSTPASDESDDGMLFVYAAASLTNAFQDLAATFLQAHAGTEIRFNFAGSQQLAQQLVAGAPGDVFASADLNQMEVVVSGNRALSSTVQIFASNQLVVIVPADNPAQLESFRDLAQPGLRLVLPAEDVPAGRYTLRFLNNAAATELGEAYRTQVLANVVSYELNVRAVLTKVTLGEADAGIVYGSDAIASSNPQPNVLPIPEELNVVAAYYLAPLLSDNESALAVAFIAFVLSEEGQRILQRHGFMPPQQPAPE